MFSFYPLKNSPRAEMASFGAEGDGQWWAQSGSPCACDMLSKLYAGHDHAGLLISSKQSGIKQ